MDTIIFISMTLWAGQPQLRLPENRQQWIDVIASQRELYTRQAGPGFWLVRVENNIPGERSRRADSSRSLQIANSDSDSYVVVEMKNGKKKAFISNKDYSAELSSDRTEWTLVTFEESNAENPDGIARRNGINFRKAYIDPYYCSYDLHIGGVVGDKLESLLHDAKIENVGNEIRLTQRRIKNDYTTVLNLTIGQTSAFRPLSANLVYEDREEFYTYTNQYEYQGLPNYNYRVTGIVHSGKIGQRAKVIGQTDVNVIFRSSNDRSIFRLTHFGIGEPTTRSESRLNSRTWATVLFLVSVFLSLGMFRLARNRGK
jgi:hypothetical protein